MSRYSYLDILDIIEEEEMENPYITRQEKRDQKRQKEIAKMPKHGLDSVQTIQKVIVKRGGKDKD